MQQGKQPLWTKEFIVLTVSNLFLFLELQMILSSIPSYVKNTFHASSVQVSLVTTLFALSAIAARLFSARMLEKGHRSTLIFVGLLFALAGTLGYSVSPTITVLLLMRMLFGIGFGMSSTAFPTMASDVIPPKRLGEGMGFFSLSTSLAMSIGPTIGISMLQYGSFNLLAYTTAAVIVVIFPLAYWLIRTLPKGHIEPPMVPLEDGRKPAFNRKLWIPALLNMLMSITYGGLLGFMALYGDEANLAHPAYFFLFNAVSVLIVRPFSGRIYDKKGAKALLIPGSLFLIGGLILLSYAHSDVFMYMSALCYGIGFGVMQPTLQTWMIQVVSPKQRGMANGMFLNSLDFGIAAGALMLGIIAKASDYAWMYRLSSLFIVLFLLIYVIQIVASRRPKTHVPLEG
ncbi:MFS transporter [Paenibacillus sp. S25]|uniref:MFS transporter n=1 Tax=unclassified Paenibacillus TaxID=185978 RepID=UPI001C64B73C|nr:MFS transporter [Paenibacillus sp. S25]QYK61524.1 putative MFS-type transporter YhhS [Paenibacillus sp. S25]